MILGREGLRGFTNPGITGEDEETFPGVPIQPFERRLERIGVRRVDRDRRQPGPA